MAWVYVSLMKALKANSVYSNVCFSYSERLNKAEDQENTDKSFSGSQHINLKPYGSTSTHHAGTKIATG